MANDMLLRTAYLATRELLVPSHQQLDQYDYPRIVLLRSLDDVATTTEWRTTSGDLLWDKMHGYRLFHIGYPGYKGHVSAVRPFSDFVPRLLITRL